MIRALPPENCTDQSGTPGPWFQRLPHFRADHLPSSGAELQSEYLIDREFGRAALEAVRGTSDVIAPVLQVCEIRTVAADELWLSPAYGRKSLAIHFTWLPDPMRVTEAVSALEQALDQLGARPHWGKVFNTSSTSVAALFPRLKDFRALAREFDPDRCFSNSLIDRYVLGSP